mmetsp:Transcript_4252/g.5845  ORF Transcript_4252/g.5845 Transcript_4252/m.5845 type:complete len:552 (+) Transcript_4252:257-1912(+)
MSRDENDNNYGVNSLVAAMYSPVPVSESKHELSEFFSPLTEASPNRQQPRQVFGSYSSNSHLEQSVLSDTAAFTSLFDDDGALNWEKVESGMVCKSVSGVCENNTPHEGDLTTNTSSHSSNHLTVNRCPRAKVLNWNSFDFEAIAALPFTDKQTWFYDRMAELQIPSSEGFVKIEVRRSHILTDTHRAFTILQPADLHKWIRIQFYSEPGVDSGGLKREWETLVTKDIFDAERGLFTCDSFSASSHINTTSGISLGDSHLSYFRFIGRFIGKCIMDQQCIAANLSLPLRKQILSVPITFSDLEFVDVELYKHLIWLKRLGKPKRNVLKSLTSREDSVAALMLDFTVAYAVAAQTRLVSFDLVPNGSNIAVTEENKEEYLQARLRNRMLDSIKPQLENFLFGLYELIPPELLAVFDYQELDLLICGIPRIDVSDWKANTEYSGVYSGRRENHPVIQWFWQCVQNMSGEERVRLLQFITGCPRVPVQGFKALKSYEGNSRKFNIHSIHKYDSVYPRAHTCFNRLDLPLYDKQSEMEAHLSVIVNMELAAFNME